MTRAAKVRVFTRSVLIYCAIFTVLGYFTPKVFDQLAPADRWIKILDAKIVSYDSDAMIASYRWHRYVKESTRVAVNLELTLTDNGDNLLWSTSYPNVLYEGGTADFIMLGKNGLREFPDLPPGIYEIHGLLAFKTSQGIEKQLEFAFEPYIVE